MMLRKSKEKAPLPVNMTNFGASLKKARESKGISLEQIAKETRISTRFLDAIENEEFHLLPGGIFNRGFVRSFAERVGLDPEETVAEYQRLVTAPEPSDALASANAGVSKGGRHLYPIAIGILAIAIAIFYIVTRDSGGASEIATPPPVTSTAAAAAEPAVSPPAATVEPEPATPPILSQALTLDVEAREKTWIRVTSDGNSVTSGEVLEPGMTRKFTAESSLYISIGNAAGLTLRINDKPLKPLGTSGQVRSVTITPANLKDFIG